MYRLYFLRLDEDRAYELLDRTLDLLDEGRKVRYQGRRHAGARIPKDSIYGDAFSKLVLSKYFMIGSGVHEKEVFEQFMDRLTIETFESGIGSTKDMSASPAYFDMSRYQALLDDEKSYRRAQSIWLDTDMYGKPHLPDTSQAYGGIEFNISHSYDMVAVCVSDRNVGIDIQKTDKKGGSDYMRIAKRFFTENEYDRLCDIEAERDRKNTFYKMWTVKEAVLKMDGRGLSVPPSEFDIYEDVGHYLGHICETHTSGLYLDKAYGPLAPKDLYINTVCEEL